MGGAGEGKPNMTVKISSKHSHSIPHVSDSPLGTCQVQDRQGTRGAETSSCGGRYLARVPLAKMTTSIEMGILEMGDLQVTICFYTKMV